MLENSSIGRAKYVLTFNEYYSGFVSVHILENKSEFPEMFEEFKNLVENQNQQKNRNAQK